MQLIICIQSWLEKKYSPLFNYFRSNYIPVEVARRARKCLLNDLNQFWRHLCGEANMASMSDNDDLLKKNTYNVDASSVTDLHGLVVYDYPHA